MMAMVLTPLGFALVCLALPSGWWRKALLIVGCAVHAVAVASSWPHPPAPWAGMAIDPLGHLFLTLISGLFLATSVFFAGYHSQKLISQRVFMACMLALESALTVVCLSGNLGLLWVAIEASSLAAAPLVYFRLTPKALEATWKYLLVNSVGIALALLGIFCVAIAAMGTGRPASLNIADLAAAGPMLDPRWLRAGFLLSLVGFGTKMGLAPLHGWKPDVYGESPPPTAALMAGGLTLEGFIGLLRMHQICSAAGLASFCGGWMIAFGLLSVAVAGVFIWSSVDFRRLLAFTSVEHVGLLTLGVGLGSVGAYAGMLHAMHNTLNKAALFFVAGFLWRTQRTDRMGAIRGVIHRHPWAGVLLLGGMAATLGLPPFGMFYSEMAMVFAAAGSGRYAIAGVLVAALAMVFIGVLTAVWPMAVGTPRETEIEPVAERWHWRRLAMLAPAAAALALGAGLGIHQPVAVTRALNEAAMSLNPPTMAVASAGGTR